MLAAEHPDWPAFLAAIVADADDDTARLAAADFLEENGDPDRAAFIRIQVELARLEVTGQGKSLEADELRKHERAFLGPLSMDRQFWAAADCPELVRMPGKGGGHAPLEGVTVEGAERLTWQRGFVEGVTCSAAEWLRHGEAVRRRNPVHTVILTGCDRMTRDNWYAATPALTGLRSVQLVDAFPGLAHWLRDWLPGSDVVEVIPY
jgi:uncharacterized protein (TIGR02996 family)